MCFVVGKRRRPLLVLDDLDVGKAYSVPDVANAWGYSKTYIRELIRQGRIDAFKPGGGEWRIHGAEARRLADVIDERGSLPPKPETPVNLIYVTPEEADLIMPGWRSRPSEAA